MPGEFIARLDEIARAVGEGDLEAASTVDQVYARYQHFRTDLRHPRGGGPFYLQSIVEQLGADEMARWARSAIEGGRPMWEAATETTRKIIEAVAVRAPVEFNNLRRSADQKVTDNGAVVYHVPPAVGRLSEAQLRAERRRGGSNYRRKRGW